MTAAPSPLAFFTPWRPVIVPPAGDPRPTERVPSIIVVVQDGDEGAEPLRQAARRAQVGGLQLVIVRALRPFIGGHPLFDGPDELAALGRRATFEAARLQTRKWAEAVLRKPVPDENIVITEEAVTGAVDRLPPEVDPQLLVVPSTGLFKVLRRHLPLPVLLARAGRRGGLVVAATDCGSELCPTLVEATHLARMKHTEAIFFHNVRPLPATPPLDPTAATVEREATRALRLERAEQLHAAATRLHADASILVASKPSTTQALLELAHTSAEVIVVGAHHCHDDAPALYSSVATRLADLAPCSVMSVPVTVKAPVAV